MDKLKLFDVIKHPIVTDKASSLNKDNKVGSKLVISVDRNANKKTVKEAVESLFGVKVLDVNTMNITGKRKYSARKYEYKQSDYKKAIVTIAEGSNVESLNSSSEINEQDESVQNFVSQEDSK